jgi:fucose 4-O-acetylase-like acetyltransferase
MANRNKIIDVMLAIGIIFVVMGHNYQPDILLLPAYTFQVALFFFVSGYFFRVQTTFHDKLIWLKKKAAHLLVPYFLFNVFFAVLTYYLSTRGVSLGEIPTWYNFFIMPFTTGQQYYLYLAAWFVPQLFLIHLAAQTLIFKDKPQSILWLLLPALAVAVWFVDSYSLKQGYGWLVLGRTAFGLSFYLLGWLLKRYESKVAPYLVRPETFLLIYIIYVSLGSFFGAFNYSLILADFKNNALVTLGGTLSALLMIYIVSSYLGRVISERSLILKIGQNTFSIMALHLLVFFSINYLLYRAALIPAASLSNVFFHYQEGRIWFIYSGLGIIIPLVLAGLFRKARASFKPLLKLN